MSWFEAYLLWNLESLAGIFAVSTALATLGSIIFTIFYFINSYVTTEDDEIRWLMQWYKRALYWKKYCAKGLKITIPVAVFSAFILALTPSTETLLKIIATKKGVDAIQSDTGTKYLNEVDKAVSNGLKLLNQEIEKKLGKKKEAK